MRGRSHCRSHLDHILGSRGAGAPGGNLNALKSGAHAHPLSERYLMDLAHELVLNPNRLKPVLTQIINQLYRRAGPTPSEIRALKTLVTLQIVLKSLTSHFANDLFVIGLEEITSGLPPSTRAEHTSQLWKAALPQHPIDRLLQLRQALEMYQEKNN